MMNLPPSDPDSSDGHLSPDDDSHLPPEVEVGGVDDRLVEMLVEFDQALLAGKIGGTSVLLEAAVPPELAEQLEANLEFLALLHETARSAGSTIATDGVPWETSAGHEFPDEIGRFKIVREIGLGAQGIVLLAMDTSLNRQVALKIPRWETLTKPESLRRFLREAKIVAQFSHPNIVTVYEVGRQEPIWFIATEYCPGQTLSEWLLKQDSPVPTEDAVWLVITIAQAIHYAHEHGVIHRDIKPGNIILSTGTNHTESQEHKSPSELRNFTPKLMDFGLARIEIDAATTRDGVIMGTPAYMSPEQAEGRSGEIGPATDVYSLGALLYTLLVGTPPIVGSSDPDILRRIISEEPVPPRKRIKTVPRDLCAITMKCLEKDPMRRYLTARAMAIDLTAHLQGWPVSVRPPNVVEQLIKSARRRPTLAMLLSLMAALFIGIPIVALNNNNRLRHLLEIANQERVRADENKIFALQGQSQARAGRYASDVRLAFQMLNAHDGRLSSHLQTMQHDHSQGNRFELQFLNKHKPQEQNRMKAHESAIYFMRSSSDGRYLATAGRDKTLKVWDNEKLTLLRSFEVNRIASHACPVAFSSNGSLVAYGDDDRRVIIARASSGENVLTLELPREINCMDFSPDMQSLAVGAGHSVHAFRLVDGQLVWSADCHPTAITGTVDPSIVQFGSTGTNLSVSGFVHDGSSFRYFAGLLESLTGRYFQQMTEVSPRFDRDAFVQLESFGNQNLVHAEYQLRIKRLRELATEPRNTKPAIHRTFDCSLENGHVISISMENEIVLTDLDTGQAKVVWGNHYSTDITSCALIQGSRRLAIGLNDGTLVTCNAESPSYPVQPTLPTPLRHVFASSADSSKIATIDIQNRLWIHQANEYIESYQLPVETQYLAIALSPEGKHLASVTLQGLELRDLKNMTAVNLNRQSPHRKPLAPVFTPDGTILISQGPSENALFVWPLMTEATQVVGSEPALTVQLDSTVSCFGNGLRGTGQLIVGTSNQQLTTIELATGSQLGKSIQLGVVPTAIRAGTATNYVAVGTENGTLSLIDMQQHKVLWNCPPHDSQSPPGPISDIAFSFDESHLFTIGNDCIYHRTKDGSPVWQIKHPVYGVAIDKRQKSLTVLQQPYKAFPTLASWTLDGRKVASLTDWVPRTVESLSVFGTEGMVAALEPHREMFSDDLNDHTVRKWLFGSKAYGDSLAGTTLGSQIKLFSSIDRPAELWPNEIDTQVGRTLITGANRQPWLAAGGNDGSVEVWDVVKHRMIARLFISDSTEESWKRTEKLSSIGMPFQPEYPKNGEPLVAAAFSADDSRLFIAGDKGSVRCWNTSEWSLTGQVKLKNPASTVAVNPRDLSCAIGQPHSIVSWDGKSTSEPTSVAMTTKPTSAAYSNDGTHLFVGCLTGEIHVLLAEKNNPLVTLLGHTSRVSSLSVSPDGQTMVSGSHDGSLKLWTTEYPAELGTLGRHPGRCNAVSFSRDGNAIYSGGDADENGFGSILIWDAK